MSGNTRECCARMHPSAGVARNGSIDHQEKP
jgi:hypothetical protein